MWKIQKSLPLLWTIFLLHFPVYSKYPSYKNLDSILEETWNKNFPLPYNRIVKRNPNQLGIYHYKDRKNEFFIYSYLVAMNHWKWNENTVQVSSEERIISVLLFYEPNNKENPYTVRIGEIQQQDLKQSFLRIIPIRSE